MIFGSCSDYCWKLGFASYLVICEVFVFGSSAWTQVVPDSTLGAEGSIVTSKVVNGTPTYQIDGGATRGGKNLFHSFQQFSISAGHTAYFNNAPGIQNIISRVTGRSVSDINGTIRSNPTVNLFLINPNGIIFGPNASLSIGGSFLASTASRLNFADGSQFSASSPQAPPLLTIDVPVGLQFGANPRSILAQSQASLDGATNSVKYPAGLQVQTGQTLALVGGDFTLEGGNLTARGGRIELGSVGSDSLVNLKPMERGWVLSYQGVQNFQKIQLTPGSSTTQPYIDVSGEVGSNSEAGGSIHLRSKQVTITGQTLLSTTLGVQSGEDLTVTASESVKLIGSNTFFYSLTYGFGNAGNITINTGALLVQDGAQIATTTRGEGSGGQLIINARDSVKVVGTAPPFSVEGQIYVTPSILFTDALEIGNAGNIAINTGKLLVQDGGVISSRSSGTVNSTSGIFIPALGRGGNVTVNASDSVGLSGTSPDADPSGLFTSTLGEGVAGNLTINTGLLVVRDGAGLNVGSEGTGAAGNLEVKARSIYLDNRAFLRADTVAGQGNINLNSQNLVLRHGSSITTNAQATATGGNITIDTGSLVALENSDVSANAQKGSGGRVVISAQGIFGTEFRNGPTLESDITATSDLGLDFNGIVNINTPDVDLNRVLVTLPTQPVNVTGLIAQGCLPGGGQVASQFVVTGRGGLPDNPSQTLSNDTVWSDLRSFTRSIAYRPSAEKAIQPTNATTKQLVEAQGWVINNEGEVVLTAAAPEVTPHSPWMTPTGCHAP